MKHLITPEIFEIGQYYTNDQIQYALNIGNSGGIRPRLDEKGNIDFIVLITSGETGKNIARNPYTDRIEGNVLTYTGAGLKGEQAISGVNKRLLEQREGPVPILGFVKEDVNKYRFIGFLYLLRNYEDYQLDHEGFMRKVFMFEFQIVTDISALKVGKFREMFLPIFTKLQSEVIVDDRIVQNFNIDRGEQAGVESLKEVGKLRNQLLTVDPYKFEIVVSKLVTHVGFDEVKVTRKSGDDGIDVSAILKNPIASDLKYLFQVKRWSHSVGRNEVANLRGSMGLNNQGVIISTSYFTKSAINEAKSEYKTPINLIGMKELFTVIVNTGFQVYDETSSSISDL